jgi:hypothetical protein
MTPSAILILIIVYFGTLFYISHRVSRKDDGNDAFFTANKNSINSIKRANNLFRIIPDKFTHQEKNKFLNHIKNTNN